MGNNPVDGVYLNQATITLFGVILTPMTTVIVALWLMLKGRLDRAEKQVDTLLPALNTMSESLRSIKEDSGKTSAGIDAMRSDLNRLMSK